MLLPKRLWQIQSPTFSPLQLQVRQLQGEIGQQTQRVGEVRVERDRMRQEIDLKMENVLFERDGLEERLDSTASQLFGARHSLRAVHERLEQHSGHSSAGHLRLESLLAYTVTGFVDRVDRLVGDEVAALRTRLTDVVASA